MCAVEIEVFLLITCLLVVNSVPPTCKTEPVYVSYPKTVQAVDDDIYCFNKSNTTDVDICQHSTGMLEFNADSRISNIQMVDRNETSCIILTDLILQNSETCLNVSAKVISDTQTETSIDPAIICIIFNSEGPTIIPNQSTRINVADGMVERKINITATSTDGISEFLKSGVSPTEFDHTVTIYTTNPLVFLFNSSQEMITVTEVNVSFTVKDDGNPPLTSEGVFRIELFSDVISCIGLTVYINIDIVQVGNKIGKINCYSSVNGNISYNLQQDTDFSLTIDADGELMYNTTPTVPTNGTLNLDVTSSTGISKTFTLYVMTGRSPIFSKPSYSLLVKETAETNTCFKDIFFTTNEATESMTYSLFGENQDILQFKYGNKSLCLIKTLISSARVDYNISFMIVAGNDFGNSTTMITLEVKVVVNPPLIEFETLLYNVTKSTAIGDIITVFNVTNFAETVEIKETEVPFTVTRNDSVSWSLVLIRNLDAQKYSYNVTIKATSAIGDSSETLITIMVTDNVPFCEVYVVQLTTEIDTAVATVLGAVRCSDIDGDVLSFALASGTPGYISDHIELQSDSDISNVMLSKQLTDLSTAELDNIMFEIAVTDTSNNTVNVEITLTVLVTKVPSCSGPLTMTIPENIGNSCVNITSTCSSPYGLVLQHSIIDFITSDVAGIIEMCGNFTTILLDGQSLQVQINITDGFNTVVENVTVIIELVNQYFPSFIGIADNQDTINIMENIPAGSSIYNFTVTDADNGDFGKFNITTFGLGETFNMMYNDVNSYTVNTGQQLNTSIESAYQLMFTATDTGGLSSKMFLNVSVLDVNEAPICMSETTFNISVLAESGSLIGRIQCWDYDTTKEFSQIEYSIHPEIHMVPVSVDYSGNLTITGPLFNQSNVITFKVLAISVDLETEIIVTLFIERNFPPVCNATTMNTVFQEDSTGCSHEKLRCTNQLSTHMMWTITNNHTDDLLAQITNNTVDELDVRICLSHNNKKTLFQDSVKIQIFNDLGTETITWTVTIEDVNEAPTFMQNTYVYNVTENTAYGTIITTIDVSNRLPNGPNEENSIILVDLDTADGFNVKNVGATGEVIMKAGNKVVPDLNLPMEYVNMGFKVISQLDPQYTYRYTIQAIDGGNLTATTVVDFIIQDVNSIPTCSEPTALKLPILQQTTVPFYNMNCSDGDYVDSFRSLSYSIQNETPDLFGVTMSGALFLKSKLPRDLGQHNFQVVVKDGGVPSLSTSIAVIIDINRLVSASCNPAVIPPNVWIKGECITVDSRCTDPTTGDNSTLSYSASGNYLPDFYIGDSQNGSNGILKLCYAKTENGEYEASITVNNGLKELTLSFNITVIYLRSVPVFDVTQYIATKDENFAIGSEIVVAHATSTGNFSGKVIYTIKETDPVGAGPMFKIDANGTVISVNSLRPYSSQQIKITIQAEDDRSFLASTALVIVTIRDINEPPSCSDGNPVHITVGASVEVGYVIYTFNCSDPDKTIEYNQITTNLSGSSYFSRGSGQQIKTISQLPVTSNPIYLTYNVFDGTFTVSFQLIVTILFEPSNPELSIGPVETNSIELRWSYFRPESLLYIKRHIIEKQLDGSTYHQVDRASASYKFEGLSPNTVYQFRLIAETTTTNLTTQYVAITTRAIPILTKVMVGFKVTNRDWSDSMINRQSAEYIQLKQETEQNFLVKLSTDKGLHSIDIVNMRPGSVVFDAVLHVNQTGTVNETEASFLSAIYSSNLGNLTIDAGSGVIYQGDQYISVPTLTLLSGTANQLIEGTVIKYACNFRFVSLTGLQKPIVQWFLDDSILKLTHTPRIKLSNTSVPTDRFGYIYTLEFDTAIPSHSGMLMCKITSSSKAAVTASKASLVYIIPKPVVTLWPLSSFIKDGTSVTLTCTSIQPATYSWYDANSNTLISSASTNKYNVSMVDRDLKYYCKASNFAGSTNTQIAVIYYIPSTKVGLSCMTSMDTRDTRWPTVKAGASAKLECGAGYEGYCQRNCSNSGHWSAPDYSKCKKTNLVILKRKTDDVKEGKLVQTPEETLETLVNLTTDSSLFSAGDVEISIQILQDVVDINNDDKSKIIKKVELENFAVSASNVLNADDEEWITLSNQGKSSITAMIETIDAMAKLTSNRLNNSAPITAFTDKMVIEVGRSSLTDIEFPRSGEKNYPTWMSESINTVLLKKDTLQKYFNDDKDVGYNAIYYNGITTLLEDIILDPGQTARSNGSGLNINSKILAFSVNPSPTGILDPPIKLSFQHLSGNFSNPSCVFLDLKRPYENTGRWSTEGCETEATSDPNVTICKCSHLTNFAVLMSPGKTPIHHVEALSIISIVGCVISLLCLLITICIYAYLWRYIKNDKAVILMNLCVTLIIAYVLFLGGVNQTSNKAVCQTISVLLHFFYLVVFCLMLAEGLEVFISVVYVFATKSRLKWILLGSWGLPVIIVGISVGITQLEGYGNDDFCWLSLESGLLWAFVGPAIAVICINLIIMVKVLTVMFSTTTMVTKTMKEKGRTGLKALCVLLPIMGLTWVFGVFSVNEDLITFQYLFAVFNSLQGLFIFIFHCLMCRQVKDGIKMKRRRYRAKSIDTSTKSLTQMPLQTTQTRSTSDSGDKKPNDLDKKNSPFLEVDRQVQELARKLAKFDNNNIQGNASKKDNITPEPKVNPNKSEHTIYDDFGMDASNIAAELNIPNKSSDDLYSCKNLRDDNANNFTQKSLSHVSSSSNHPEKKISSSVTLEGYDKLLAAGKGYINYTKLDKDKNTGPENVAFSSPAAQPIQKKMPSIEYNSKQQAPFFPESDTYLPQNVPVVKRESSPTRHYEPTKPSVAPKSKSVSRGINEDDDKIQNIDTAYAAVDAYYVGPQSTPTKDYSKPKSKKPKTSSNPSLNQPQYYDNYPPADKWAKLKETKSKMHSQNREGPQNRRIQSHEDISGYRSQVYQPLGGVQILRDTRDHPRQAPRYQQERQYRRRDQYYN